MVATDKDIAKWVQSPYQFSEEDIAKLNQAVEAYPWCSTYRMLLAKAYDNQDSYLKSKTLKLAATYASNREQLFKLMYDQTLIKVEVIEEKQQLTTTREDTVEAKSETTENAEDAILKQEANNQSQELPESNEVESPKTQEKVTTETEKVDFDEIVKYDPLVELKDKRIDTPEESRVKLPFDYVAYNPEKELEKLIENKEEAEQGDKKDFLFWLNNVETKEDVDVNEDRSPDKVQSLLDQFLATRTTRPIQPREFYKPETKAEKSEIDGMEVVSETLVELYVKQGYYAKAIQGLEKLSLLNPPKSAYFAARIREIEQLQKDN